jgi:hypothetical protein
MRPGGSPSRDDGEETTVLREVLGVLLEVRAHVDAYGAQLERVRAQLERLDARVSTLEREGRATRRGSGANASSRRQPRACGG